MATNYGVGYIPLIAQIKAMQAKQIAQSPLAQAINPSLPPEEKMDLFGIAKIPKPQLIPLENGELPGMAPLSGRK
jgi:hypothetical protein